IGLPVTAFVFVVYMHDSNVSQWDLAERIAEINNVYEVHLISGEWDILVKIRGESLEKIGQIVLDEIRPLKGIVKTITCPSFANIKNGL
ncbi:MAG: Lrp/AsnC family transcriptional regulator, partial [Candidatus Heimdallarchaeota archaeon]